LERIKRVVLLLPLIVFSFFSLAVSSSDGFSYRTPEQLRQELKSIAGNAKGLSELHDIGKSAGGQGIALLELGNKKNNPAILVVANMEGNAPLASEAAIELARTLTTEWKDYLNDLTWYILPLGNPDGYASFFSNPVNENFGNARSVNADNDDAADEDGPEDLNGDGFITMMRQKHPEGKWIEVSDNPLFLKKAKGSKGEVGLYRLFDEGIDNDGDGEINEDGRGGSNPGRNFPHDFRHYTTTDGLHSASESETRALLSFAFDHTDIAMILVFGRSNSLKEVPSGSKKASSGGGSYSLPKRWAEQMGVSPDEKFPIKELVEMARDYTGWQELDEDMVLQFLGVGAAVNPDKNDRTYWEEISKKYADFIKEAELDGERLDPPGFVSGSVEEWAYYQYGVPTFTMDFWTLPKPEEEKEEKSDSALTPDDLKEMTEQEFIDLGEEKITVFLKENDAPSQYTATMVIKALKGGMMTTKQMAKFMAKSKKDEEGGGADEVDEAAYAYDSTSFVNWTPYNHPTIGKVEIGGRKPFVTLAPRPSEAMDLIKKQLPFTRELSGMLPSIKLGRIEIEKRGSNVFKVDAWVTNTGGLPYPTHQGQRCKRPSPATITITGKSIKLLEGKKRTAIGLLEGSGGAKKLSWLIKGSGGSTFKIDAHTFSAGQDSKTVTLKGGVQ